MGRARNALEALHLLSHIRPAQPLELSSTPTHAGAAGADSEFVNLGMSSAPVRVLVKGAVASFERCTFLNNTVPSTSVGIITASLHAVALRLEDCSFDSSAGAAAPRSLVDANGSALVFSDEPRDVWLTEEAARSTSVAGANGSDIVSRTQPLWQIPRTIVFLNSTDVWLRNVQQVWQPSVLQTPDPRN